MFKGSQVNCSFFIQQFNKIPDSKVHGANMEPTLVLPAPDWPHVPCYQGYINGVMVHRVADTSDNCVTYNKAIGRGPDQYKDVVLPE